MIEIQFTASKCFTKPIESVTLKGHRYYIVFLRILYFLCQSKQKITENNKDFEE